MVGHKDVLHWLHTLHNYKRQCQIIQNSKNTSALLLPFLVFITITEKLAIKICLFSTHCTQTTYCCRIMPIDRFWKKHYKKVYHLFSKPEFYQDGGGKRGHKYLFSPLFITDNLYKMNDCTYHHLFDFHYLVSQSFNVFV